MAQQLQEGDRVEVQTPNGVWYRGTVIKFGVFDGLQVWLDQLPFGLTSHRVVSVPDIRRLPNQPPRPVSYLEMVAATFPAGVGVLFEGERWVVLKTASEEFPALLLRLWWWSERSEKYVHRDTEVAAEDAFKILRRPDLPARSKFFRLGA